jgi:hypothetical protein
VQVPRLSLDLPPPKQAAVVEQVLERCSTRDEPLGRMTSSHFSGDLEEDVDMLEALDSDSDSDTACVGERGADWRPDGDAGPYGGHAGPPDLRGDLEEDVEALEALGGVYLGTPAGHWVRRRHPQRCALWRRAHLWVGDGVCWRLPRLHERCFLGGAWAFARVVRRSAA